MNDSYLADDDFSGVQSEADIARLLSEAQTPGPSKYDFKAAEAGGGDGGGGYYEDMIGADWALDWSAFGYCFWGCFGLPCLGPPSPLFTPARRLTSSPCSPPTLPPNNNVLQQ